MGSVGEQGNGPVFPVGHGASESTARPAPLVPLHRHMVADGEGGGGGAAGHHDSVSFLILI